MTTQPHEIKAADLLVETLKGVLTLATVLLAALLGYVGSTGSSLKWQGTTALVAFAISAILTIFAINALINKLNSNDASPISATDVKAESLLSVIALAAGLIFAGLQISCTRTARTSSQKGAITVDNSRVTVSSPIEERITVVKRPDGGVEKIIIEAVP